MQTITSAWDIGDMDPKHYKKAVTSGITIAIVAWGSAPPSVQRYVGLSTTLLLCIDDFACSKNALAEFADRFYAGLPQLHPIRGPSEGP